MKKVFRYWPLFVLMGLLSLCSGCFQAHADDDLRGVPVTNNPNLIPAGHIAQAPPGMGY